jgi:hypothetical protein
MQIALVAFVFVVMVAGPAIVAAWPERQRPERRI